MSGHILLLIKIFQIPDVLFRILNAAHHAPSVGFSQPWNFILIKSKAIRMQVKESFLKEYRKSIALLEENNDNKQRKEKYMSLKLEGIMESALDICVTYDHNRFSPFVLGRTSIAETGYTVCVVQFKTFGWLLGLRA
jgi:5,6-dimethylbenzimidazole synthase